LTENIETEKSQISRLVPSSGLGARKLEPTRK